MSGLKEYENFDAVGMVDLVCRKRVDPQKLLEVADERVGFTA